MHTVKIVDEEGVDLIDLGILREGKEVIDAVLEDARIQGLDGPSHVVKIVVWRLLEPIQNNDDSLRNFKLGDLLDAKAFLKKLGDACVNFPKGIVKVETI